MFYMGDLLREKPLHRPSGLITNAQADAKASEKVRPCLMGLVRILFGTARYDLFIKERTHTNLFVEIKQFIFISHNCACFSVLLGRSGPRNVTNVPFCSDYGS